MFYYEGMPFSYFPDITENRGGGHIVYVRENIYRMHTVKNIWNPTVLNAYFYTAK